jgi:hypothetical protein
MGMLDDARRWVTDRLSHDEYINGTPKEHMRTVDESLSQLSPNERLRNVAHVRAYSEYYYQGRHRESVPAEVRQQFAEMDRRIERLNAVDAARETLTGYGGPPSRDTVAESIDRSIKERQRESIKQAPTEAVREHVGPRMHI